MLNMRHDPRVRDDFDLEDDTTMRLVGLGKGDREDKFRKRFIELPKEEELINYYSCALSKDYYLQHGAIYITANFICFRSNIFGQERKLIIPTADVEQIFKVNTFRLIPSGLVIITRNHKYQFESFRNRQSAFNILKRVTEKRTANHVINAERDPLLSPEERSRSPDKQQSLRFIKSQSSCSLDRKGQDSDDVDSKEESFLRPLSATVMHDYVVRKNSRVASVASHPDNLCLASTNSVEQPLEIDLPVPSLQTSQSCQTGSPGSPVDCIPKQFPENPIYDTPQRNPTISFQISSQAFILAGYFICTILVLAALKAVKDLLFPSTCAISGMPRINPAHLEPLNNTLHLLDLVIDASINIIIKVQRLQQLL